MRNNIAEHAREILFGIPARIADHEPYGLRKLGIATHFHLVISSLVAAERAQRQRWRTAKRGVGYRVWRRRKHFAGVADGKANREGKDVECSGIPSEWLQTPQRPALTAQDVIDGGRCNVREQDRLVLLNTDDLPAAGSVARFLCNGISFHGVSQT
jgi:hypothetical protein